MADSTAIVQGTSLTCLICISTCLSHIGEKNTYQIFRCQSCGFHFTNPMPDDGLLADLYNQYASNETYVRKSPRKVSRVKNRIRRYRKFAPGHRFLDVGSAVEAATRLGFDAYGVDIGAESIEIAKKLFPSGSYHTGTVGSMLPNWNDFDFVYCADVAEHVPDPRALIESITPRIKRGGIIFIDTPDAGHFRVPRDFLKWDMVIPPFHLVYFTKKSMALLLDQCGYEVIKFEWLHKPGLHTVARKR